MTLSLADILLFVGGVFASMYFGFNGNQPAATFAGLWALEMIQRKLVRS